MAQAQLQIKIAGMLFRCFIPSDIHASSGSQCVFEKGFARGGGQNADDHWQHQVCTSPWLA